MSEQDMVVFEAASMEEARQIASERLGLAPEDFMVTVREEGRRFFGLLGKKNTYQAAPVAPRHLLRVREVVRQMARRMGVDVDVVFGEEDGVDLRGTDREMLLGTYGEPLRALEYLVNIMLREPLEGRWVRFDSEGFREHRQAHLEEAARQAASEAVRRRRPISLDPMTSWERRVVHVALKDNAEVETRSVGEEPTRRVVVWPQKNVARATSTGKMVYRTRLPR